MNKELLDEEVQEFINENLNSNLTDIILKGSPFKNVSIQDIAQQIFGKQKAKNKLPSWYKTPKVIYPPKLNLEQCSSELTAEYKASLANGKYCADITGGFGIDTVHFTERFERVWHCEINPELTEILKHNTQVMGVKNLSFYSGNGLDFIFSSEDKFDLIFVDPSRRDNKKSRVFLVEDCQPNMLEYLNQLFEKADTILIKYAPMLDIEMGIRQLQRVKEVHVVAVGNEVKELLFLLHKGKSEDIKIKAVNLNKDHKDSFNFNYKSSSSTQYQKPLTYLYEPNKAILKAGGFKHVSARLDVFKLHEHSHLYTSEEHISFPGRSFAILSAEAFNKKNMKKWMKKKANIACRNFPLTPNEIKKRFNLKDGGDDYLFFSTDIENNHVIIHTQKIQ